MKLTVRCGDGEALVGYLYGECEPEERSAVAGHLAVCETCAEEMAGLCATRSELAGWESPEVRLGFLVIQDVGSQDAGNRDTAARSPDVPRPVPWWRQPMPAWGQVAAAVLIFSVGVAFGALRGAWDVPDSLTASSGSTVASGTTQSGALSPGDAAGGRAASTVSASDLAALEQRLRGELAKAQFAGVPTQPGSQGKGANAPVAMVSGGGATLQQVRALIQESEQRQQREMTLRTAEVVRDIDAQRRGDLVRIERTFGQMEGNTCVQVQQHQQMLNYLMRVSERPQ